MDRVLESMKESMFFLRSTQNLLKVFSSTSALHKEPSKFRYQRVENPILRQYLYSAEKLKIYKVLTNVSFAQFSVPLAHLTKRLPIPCLEQHTLLFPTTINKAFLMTKCKMRFNYLV